MHPAPEPSAEDGYAALRAHVHELAAAARERHGPIVDRAGVERLLADRQVLRWPVSLVFDAAPLLQGEFAWPRPRGERSRDGFDLVVHPHFEHWDAALPLLVAYQVPSLAYLDVATHVEAELFGSTLLGLEREAYYQRLCQLVDGMPAVVSGAG